MAKSDSESEISIAFQSMLVPVPGVSIPMPKAASPAAQPRNQGAVQSVKSIGAASSPSQGPQKNG